MTLLRKNNVVSERQGERLSSGGISCTGYRLKVSAYLDKALSSCTYQGWAPECSQTWLRINLLTDHLGAKLTRSLHLTDILTVYKCNYRFSIFVFRE